MRAVVYRGARDLRVEKVPVPRIEEGEILVRVAACGVCPTDIKKIYHATVPPPRIFGHETAGVVARVGKGVQGLEEGDRVALHHHVPCLTCHACRHRAFAHCPQYLRTGITAGFEPAGGGYAEYVRVMPFCLPGVVKIPARNSFLEGAMVEPVNTVLKGIRRLGLLRGDTVLVAGQGPIGLMFTRLLTLRGIRVIASDLQPGRLALARELGAVDTVRIPPADPNGLPSREAEAGLARVAREHTEGRGLDAVVVAVPVDSLVIGAPPLLRGGGRVLLFAHTRRGARAPIDLGGICVDEKDILGSYSSDFLLQAEAARVVFSRRLDMRRLITREFPLEETAAAVALAASPTPDSLKVVVTQELEG